VTVAATDRLIAPHGGTLVDRTGEKPDDLDALEHVPLTSRELSDLDMLASGALSIEPVLAGDWLRIAELVATYRDLPLGTVDASVVAAAERLGIAEVATLDRRLEAQRGEAITTVMLAQDDV